VAALSNYLDTIGLRFVRHHSTHSIRRHICLHAWPFHGFLAGRQSLALLKKNNKTIYTSSPYAGRDRYLFIQSAKCVPFEIKSEEKTKPQYLGSLNLYSVNIYRRPINQMCLLENICFGTLSFDDIDPNNLAAKKTSHNFQCSMIKS
jgi:hypothetical protein